MGDICTRTKHSIQRLNILDDLLNIYNEYFEQMVATIYQKNHSWIQLILLIAKHRRWI